ncbi:MAG: hypothetical protein AB1498_12970 [bacterium]
MKNITLSAEDILIKKARNKANNENTTLNELFRRWIKNYIGSLTISHDYDKFMDKVNYVKSGKKFTREEMNER